ncbi:MAG TPA: tyrosine-type recombinase/integrase [Anaeromyxobacteraceae bacterium]|nr:tyrosine-type recombinase/integrase [Anaeromyxobacteraceae bacterium]
MMRAAVKDKSYRATPVGLLVGRYLRWFRNEWGATPATIRDYEAILARMSLTLADRDPLEVTLDDLRDVIDLWADREARTRAKVTSVVRAFWTWAEDHDQVPFSPAAKLRRPRAPMKAAPLLPRNTDARLLNASPIARDRVAFLFLLDLGLRRAELAGVQPRDFDLGRRQVTVFGKGQKSRVIPIRGRIVLEIERYLLESLPHVNRTPEPDDFLLYPEKRGAGGRILAAYPKKRMSEPTIHRWWYRRLQAAELVGEGMTSGMNMHRARHTFATDLRRVADLGSASQALGHSDLSTTARIYGHYDLSDLERAMEAFARARRDEEEPAD